MGSMLDAYQVSIDEAKKGAVARAPDLIPAVLPAPAGSAPGASTAPMGADIVRR